MPRIIQENKNANLDGAQKKQELFFLLTRAYGPAGQGLTQNRMQTQGGMKR
jgi:hypothetical protein